MLTLPELSILWTLGLLVGTTAALSWGFTEVLKQGLAGYMKTWPGFKSPWYWNAVLRTTAIASGAIIGNLLLGNLVGAVVGGAAGALNTILVWAIRRRAKRFGEGED